MDAVRVFPSAGVHHDGGRGAAAGQGLHGIGGKEADAVAGEAWSAATPGGCGRPGKPKGLSPQL